MNLSDFDSIQQDAFTGSVLGQSAQISVVGWSGKRASNKYYILQCSVCSKDPELFGEGYFRALKGNLKKGYFPCGCSNQNYWTQEQQEVRAKRKAESLGLNFITWAESFTGSGTKMLMLCCDHGLWNTTKLQSMITIGHGCPKCSAEASSKREMIPEDIALLQIKEKARELGYKFIGWSEPYKGKTTKCEMVCGEHGTWKLTSAANLISGSSKFGCPGCASNKISESRLVCEQQRLDEIKVSALQKGVEFLGMLGSYSGISTKLKLVCPSHGIWETATISNFLRGSSCPSCNGHSQTQCYINIVYDEDTPLAIKFGVSRNFQDRLWSQNNYSTLKVVNHSVYIFDKSEDCKEAERYIKKSFVCGVVDKELLPDGYTETTYLTNIDKILEIFDMYGGKPI